MLPNFINGEFVVPTGVATIDVVSPSTGVKIAAVPRSTSSHVDEAVLAAREAFPAWSGLTIKARAAIMFKFHSLVDTHSAELAAIIVRENGKNLAEALADVAKGNETVEWSTSLPQLAAGRQLEVSRGVMCQETREPLGVVAAIVPFNFPAMVPMWTIPISLTMGNCVILKPSEKVPLTMQRMVELMVTAGVPPGVFQIVHGAAEVVTSMCDHPDISAVSFVGSSKVAEIVTKRCQAVNKRVLALGGAKNHLLALPDCDVAMTSRDVVASFAGCAGQRCMAASVLLLVSDGSNELKQTFMETLVKEIVATASNLKAGQAGGEVGPLIDNIAKQRVLEYINEAEANGATILLDGRSWAKERSEGFWVGPTIILHNNVDDRAMKEEIFGPVLSVYVANSWDEAIAIENANPYGNAACIYTEKGANAEWFIKKFRAAMLGVNVGIPVPREPFSFGGLYGTLSKFGNVDITGDGAMEFFSNRIKVTSKWSASYSAASNNAAKKQKTATYEDKASFDGKM